MTTTWDANALQQLAKTVVASTILINGVGCFFLPRAFAEQFNVHVAKNSGDDATELRAYYGGAGIGMGLYLLVCPDVRHALVLLKACMVPLALTRLLTLLPLQDHLLADPVKYIMHIFALLGVEVPMMTVSTLALWLLDFPVSSSSITNAAAIPTKWRVLKRAVGLLLAAESVLYWAKPVETAEWHGLSVSDATNNHLDHALGVAELRSMFAGQRFGFALFTLGVGMGGHVVDELQSRLFVAVLFSMRAASRALALAVEGGGEDGAVVRQRHLALVAMETAIALLFIRAYGQQQQQLASLPKRN